MDPGVGSNLRNCLKSLDTRVIRRSLVFHDGDVACDVAAAATLATLIGLQTTELGRWG